MNELQRKTWYKCDPNKNTKCKKSSCIFNKNAKFPVCDRTSHIEYSIDGIPLPDKQVPYHTHKEYWTKKDGERYFYNKFCNQMVCATELEYRHYTRLKTVSAISTLIALASIIIALLK